MRSGWVGGGSHMKRGGPGKGGVRTPDPPPPGHACDLYKVTVEKRYNLGHFFPSEINV